MSDGNKKSSKHKNSDGNSKRRILFSIVLDENYRSQGNSKIIRSKTNITVKLGEKKREGFWDVIFCILQKTREVEECFLREICQ